ncbi:MAG: flagellar basal body rod protein FlgB [Chromatiales bacterium]|jgi:flagellar basal-body rod protein FlgB|nr:flagellar basal body rod protein FlgB [Chromatiales bacterium]
MPITLDDALGIHAQALPVRSHRAGVIAANLANVDTPGYQARDIDFRKALQEAEQGVHMRATHELHAGRGAGSAYAGGELLYRRPLQPAVDGNTVIAHVEKAEFMKNSMLYTASLTFLGSRVNQLITALRGGQ